MGFAIAALISSLIGAGSSSAQGQANRKANAAISAKKRKMDIRQQRQAEALALKEARNKGRAAEAQIDASRAAIARSSSKKNSIRNVQLRSKGIKTNPFSFEDQINNALGAS